MLALFGSWLLLIEKQKSYRHIFHLRVIQCPSIGALQTELGRNTVGAQQKRSSAWINCTEKSLRDACLLTALGSARRGLHTSRQRCCMQQFTRLVLVTAGLFLKKSLLIENLAQGCTGYIGEKRREEKKNKRGKGDH